MPGSHLYQRTKNILHAVQALVILVAGAITVALITQGQSDSRLTYYLVISIASIALLIYQTIFPLVKFTRRFAHAYAHAIIDLVLGILWLAAFLADISWVKDGTHASGDFKNGDGACKVFAWGSTSRCTLGQVTIAMGVATW